MGSIQIVKTGGADTLRWSFRGFFASDPKDRVHGLLNLGILNEEIEALDVGYSKTVDEVFADTVLVGIKLRYSLRAFHFISHPLNYDGDEDFRSWAPRWNKPWAAVAVHDGPLAWRSWAPCGQYTMMGISDSHLKSRKLYLRCITYNEVQEIGDLVETWKPAEFYKV
jgi:hypothetical protein